MTFLFFSFLFLLRKHDISLLICLSFYLIFSLSNLQILPLFILNLQCSASPTQQLFSEFSVIFINGQYHVLRLLPLTNFITVARIFFN